MTQSVLETIVSNSDDKIKQKLGNILDKLYPSQIINDNLDLLKKNTGESLLALLEVNNLTKGFILLEVTKVEDMLSTSIYNNQFGQYLLRDLIDNANFYEQNSNFKGRAKFRNLMRANRLENHWTLYYSFNKLTLGSKISLLNIMDSKIIENLIKGRRSKVEKKEFIRNLELTRNLRNYIAHNAFILSNEPYIQIITAVYPNAAELSDSEKIKLLFSKVLEISKFSNRGHILNNLHKHLEKSLGDERKQLNLLKSDLIVKRSSTPKPQNINF